MTTVVRPRRCAAEALGDAGLGVRVDGRGRLDEHEDSGVGGEGAREHEPLALAAGQAAAALVEHALPAAGERVEDVLGGGGVQGLLGLLAGQHAERVDGVLQGAGEELVRGVADQDAATHLVEARARRGRRRRAVTPQAARARSSSRAALRSRSACRSARERAQRPGP